VCFSLITQSGNQTHNSEVLTLKICVIFRSSENIHVDLNVEFLEVTFCNMGRRCFEF
jgi:hypothetical protein